MKSLLIGTLIFSAAAVFAAPRPKTVDTPLAQSRVDSGSQQVQATIPFEFRLGDVVLPAGTYIFTYDAAKQAGWIESAERKMKIYSLSNFVKAGTESKLEFKREGKLMVLQQAPGNMKSRELNQHARVAEIQNDPASGR